MDAFGERESIGSAAPDDSILEGLSVKLSNSKPELNTIKNVTKLIDLVKNGPTNDLKTVTEAIDNANIKGLDREKFLWLTCKNIKRPKNLKDEREEAKKQMLSDLEREKKRRAEKLIKKYTMHSAHTILYQFLLIWHVWDLIKSAKSKMERCEEKFEIIEILLAKDEKRAYQLKLCIEEYSNSGRPELRKKMSDLTSELALDLVVIKRMIENVQVKLNGEIISIGNIAKQKFKFYLVNFVSFAPAIVGASVLYKLWEDLPEFYRVMLSCTTVTFAVLPLFNAKNYFNCNQILGELQSAIERIKKFNNEIQQIEVIIRRAQLVECDKPPEETS